MKKIIRYVPAAAFICGIGLCVINSIDNYGISTNTLHSEVTAQINDVPGEGDETGDGTGTGTGTGTGSGTSTAPDSVRAQYMNDGILNSEVFIVKSSADVNGKIKIFGVDIGEYQAHHFYEVTVIRYFCTYIAGCGNVCQYSDQKVVPISVVELKDPPTPNNPNSEISIK